MLHKRNDNTMLNFFHFSILSKRMRKLIKGKEAVHFPNWNEEKVFFSLPTVPQSSEICKKFQCTQAILNFLISLAQRMA